MLGLQPKFLNFLLLFERTFKKALKISEFLGYHAKFQTHFRTVGLTIDPTCHLFNAAYGYTTDGQCKYINCTIVDRRHNPCNKPVIIDYPTPEAAEGMGPIIQH